MPPSLFRVRTWAVPARKTQKDTTKVLSKLPLTPLAHLWTLSRRIKTPNPMPQVARRTHGTAAAMNHGHL